jgi:cAMP phosphodiesterase
MGEVVESYSAVENKKINSTSHATVFLKSVTSVKEQANAQQMSVIPQKFYRCVYILEQNIFTYFITHCFKIITLNYAILF